jgi:hypothetical protein
MYKSKEIRWFQDQRQDRLIDWFAKRGLRFGDTASRTDHYLLLPDRKIAFKLREGNIEVKTQTGESIPGQLAPNVAGFFEHYEKWSFKLSESDPLSKEIIQKGNAHWIATEKKRMGFKITLNPSGHQVLVPIWERIASGCQLEYTELKIKDKTSYTFALEWFGEPYLHLDQSFLDRLLDGIHLKPIESMGYAALLRSV